MSEVVYEPYAAVKNKALFTLVNLLIQRESRERRKETGIRNKKRNNRIVFTTGFQCFAI